MQSRGRNLIVIFYAAMLSLVVEGYVLAAQHHASAYAKKSTEAALLSTHP